MFKIGDKVEFIGPKRRSIHQGIVTEVTTRGARVRDPRMQGDGWDEQAEWFPFSAPNGSHLRPFAGRLDGPSCIELLIRSYL